MYQPVEMTQLHNEGMKRNVTAHNDPIAVLSFNLNVVLSVSLLAIQWLPPTSKSKNKAP